MSVLGSLSKLAGRGVVPFLKHLVGPWLMARHDLQSEVANSAKLGLAAMFPDKKLEEAFYLYSEQVSFVILCRKSRIHFPVLYGWIRIDEKEATITWSVSKQGTPHPLFHMLH